MRETLLRPFVAFHLAGSGFAEMRHVSRARGSRGGGTAGEVWDACGVGEKMTFN